MTSNNKRYPRIAHTAPFALSLFALILLSLVLVGALAPDKTPAALIPGAAVLLALLTLACALGLRRTHARAGAGDEAPAARASTEPVSLAGIQDITDYAVITANERGLIQLFNRGAEKIFGYRADECVGLSIGRLLPDEFLKSGRRALHAPTAPVPTHPRIVLGTRKDGQALPIEVCVAKHSYQDQHAYTLLVRDVTDNLRKEEQLRLSAKVFENSIEGILITNAEGQVLSVNRTFTTITGYGIEEVIARKPWEFARLPHEPKFYQDMVSTLANAGVWENEIWDRRKNGEVLAVRAKVRAIRNDKQAVSHYIVTFTDITAIKLSEEKLNNLAHNDALTNLPNRLSFQDHLRRSMTEALENQRLLAVLFIDLDRFKLINDSLEHSTGDQLLKGVSDRLCEVVRGDDVVARLGGDEFAVILTNLIAEQDATLVARKILDALASPFHLAGHELRITASIGISLFPTDGNDVQTLMKNADTAMFRAKERGRNSYELYTAAMNAQSFEQLVLENSLRKAIDNQELEVYYQPKLDFTHGSIRGLEALVRWNHPELGLVSPAQFIPLAEETGLIIAIGEWVLAQACAQHVAWIEEGLAPMPIAVNLSPRQFHQRNLADTIGLILRKTGMEPRHLELELTESGVMNDPELSIDTLNRLRAMGITVSIDDFGTGYSSLGYLRRFPITTLKIDRSFVRDVINDPDSAAIIHAIIAMARTMNLKTVAEGVETLEQLDYLRSVKCDEMQGYLFSPPVTKDKIAALMRHWQSLEPKASPASDRLRDTIEQFRKSA